MIREHEDLLLRCADHEIDTFVKPVLERLIRRPSLAQLGDEGAWPFAGSLEEAGFLNHFFWAKWEHLYDQYWQASFEDVMRRECENVIGKINDWSSLHFDLFEACCRIKEEVLVIPSSVEKWAARRLERRVYDLLIDGDMDTVRDWGVDLPDDEDDDDDGHYRENWS